MPALYVNSKDGNEWFLILANVINGIGSGLFFASEGAVVVGYPEPEKRGRYITIWVFMRNLGPIVGGAILLGLNVSTNGKGSVSLNSFAVIMGIMCLCPFVALLLVEPNQVQRNDGSEVFVTRTSAKVSHQDVQIAYFVDRAQADLDLPVVQEGLAPASHLLHFVVLRQLLEHFCW